MDMLNLNYQISSICVGCKATYALTIISGVPSFSSEIPKASNTNSMVQELQELEARINIHRNITEQALKGLQQCDPHSLNSLKVCIFPLTGFVGCVYMLQKIIEISASKIDHLIV